MGKRSYNPERRAWRGRSYNKGGQLVTDLREKEASVPMHAHTYEGYTEQMENTIDRLTNVMELADKLVHHVHEEEYGDSDAYELAYQTFSTYVKDDAGLDDVVEAWHKYFTDRSHINWKKLHDTAAVALRKG